MTPPRLVGLRTERHLPMILAAIPDDTPILDGEVVLVEVEQRPLLARVALEAEQIIFAPPTVATVRLIAVGSASPAVAAALGRRDAAALATARTIVGDQLSIDDAAWSTDGTRLNLRLSGEPAAVPTEVWDRLAERFRAEVRFAFSPRPPLRE